ncbi:Transglutaminase-like superfamily protein [Rhodobacteraceae bacterium THAF1]|uniref:transglutaminase-like domain-containing protein n=1 Tax=Palleronia sp. THAF1 TaxID=2587842 RepID=UPI000F3B5D91|nr:transglutaminase family protein [Palleronia sp. THAF1]QFU08228.1 Transglutaminase-like superfamily protein [Palleronia sp. THAF1]VDC28783.1 Transglutaminase-like superfamily protein [Rhodobacteraceae bacterium THAF1]
MKMKINVDVEYAIETPTDILLQIETAAMPMQKIIRERLDAGNTTYLSRIAAEDSIGTRVWMNVEDELDVNYTAEIEITRTAEDISKIPAEQVHKLPHEAVRYLMASRYCPSDEFVSFVGAEFAHVEGGACIVEMANWIKERFTYSPGASGPGTTALETFVQRRGICRDFAHVLITLARAKAIPARMVSCYGPEVSPQDFHAMAEVWLDGRWHLVDPTGMSSPDRTAIIGVGRDAADIAFLTSYGWVTLQNQQVRVEEV